MKRRLVFVTSALVLVMTAVPKNTSSNTNAIRFSPPSGALCNDANNDGNPEYPTMDSKCTMVEYDDTGTNIYAKFKGPQFGTRSSDPVCSSIATDVVCRRICGDLPAGKTPANEDKHTKSIAPNDKARFDKFEQFYKPDKGHYSVCYRVKNWANDGVNNGLDRTFSFRIPYK